LAHQIANALAAAGGSSTLDVVPYSGGPLPPVPSGDTIQELVLSPTVSGVVSVPAAASGVTEVLVIQNTQPITVYGAPGLEILGSTANVTIIDPTIIDLAANGSSTNTDSVTLTAADTLFSVAMRAGHETVVAQGGGSGTINGGSVADLINLTADSGNILVVSDAAGGGEPAGSDTLYAGSGSTTIDNMSVGGGERDVGGSGNLLVNDAGSADTISAGLGNATVNMAGTNAVMFGGLGTLDINAAGGAGATVAFGLGGGTFISSAASSDALVFGGNGAVSVNASSTTNDTIVGGDGALTVSAGSATGLLVFGPVSGTGMDFIGGSNSATVVGQSGHDTITGGTGPLVAIAGPNETLSAAGGSAGTTLFGGANGDLTYTGSSGTLEFIAGSGNETLNGTGSSTNNTFWGGLDSTAGNSLGGGTGNDGMIAGLGADTFTGGGGNNEYLFFNSIMSVLGANGPHDVITDFLTGSNGVDLYGLSVSGSASSSGNTTVTLSDNTTIEFLGVGSYSEISNRITTFS
jgi:hypothetical protein